MSKSIRIKLAPIELEELCRQLSVIRLGNNINNIPEAITFETLSALQMRLKMMPTILKERITFTISIMESSILWHLISKMNMEAPITFVAMTSLREQIELKCERYIAEMRELQHRG